MTLSTTKGCLSLQDATVYRRCRLFRIIRKDGETLHITNHNRDVEFEGTWYRAAGSGGTTARRRDANLKASNQEIRGIIASDKITTEDLDAGRYDGCRIDEFTVDWKYPWRGYFNSTTYLLNRVTFTNEEYTADAQGLHQLLERNIGHTIQVDCEFDVGEEGCYRALTTSGNPSALSVNKHGRVDGEAVTGIFANNPLKFAASGISNDYADSALSDGTTNQFFRFGRVQWVTGENAGQWGNIVFYDHTTREISLASTPGRPIQNGDTFNLYAGCDRRRVTCVEVWDNIRQFRGFEFIPTGSGALEL